MGDRDGDGSRAANVLAPGAPRTPGGPPQQTGATPGSSEGVPIDGRQMQEARVSPIQTSAGAGEAIPACPPPLPRNTCIRQGVGTWSTTPPAPPARVLGAQSCSPPPNYPPACPHPSATGGSLTPSQKVLKQLACSYHWLLPSSGGQEPRLCPLT